MIKQKWVKIVFLLVCFAFVFVIGIKGDIFTSTFKRNKTEKSYNVVINEVMVNNRNYIQDDEGDYNSYLELYNNSDTSVNLKDFGLSNESKNPFLWQFPKVIIQPRSFLVVWVSGKDKKEVLHTNFKFKKNDKFILLTAPDSTWSTIFLTDNNENISSGCKPDGSYNIVCFDGGTAGKDNTLEPLADGAKRLKDVNFSMPGGFFEKGIVLLLTHEDSEAEIHYTTDGTIPNKNSLLYKGEIKIAPKNNGATVIRACALKKGFPKSNAVTNTYFVTQNILTKYDIPVVSIVTEPANLFDYNKGIYVGGKVQDEWRLKNPKAAVTFSTPGNYSMGGKSWERQAHLEVIEPDGKTGLSQEIGIRTHGGYSLSQENKSLKLLASTDYDDSDIFKYDFFKDSEEDLPVTGLILRNSATDAKSSFFRDAFIQSLADPKILDLQKSQPCIAFINGKYYGIYNLRTLYNEQYIVNKYGIVKEDVVILKNPSGGVGDEVQAGFHGDEMPYCKLIQFIKEKDMRKNENYEFVETLIDIDNYIEYNILEIFCGNEDWPANNVRIWRKRTPCFEPNAPYGHDGRWRWMVFDLDYGFGMFGKSYKIDTMAMATAINSTDWNNPDEFTVLLRSLLTNDTFKNKFISRFEYLLNTNYSSKRIVEKLNKMQNVYAPYVKDHINRWNLHEKKMQNWLKEITVMKNYAINRPIYIRKFYKKYFETP